MGGRNGKENGFAQPSLAGLEAEKPEETELDNCLVLEQPVYKQTARRKEWRCALRVLPSIFQPERDWHLLASATNELAVEARKKSLKPGDRTILRGVVTAEPVQLQSGETQIIYHMMLTTEPKVSSREKRVSTTVYEQQRKRR
jgi:hypothetical protein